MNRLKYFATRFIQLAGILLPALSLVFMAGCSQISLTGGKPKTSQQQTQPQQVSLPPEITTEKELMDPTELAQLPRTNPFTNLLFPDITPVDPGPTGPVDPTPPPPPPPNPFEGFSLSGILFRDKKSQAIVSLPPENKTRIVHIGDTLSTPVDASFQIKVAKITKSDMTLDLINPPANYPSELKSTTLKLASLIGYKGKSSDSSVIKSGTDKEESSSTTPEIPKELEELLGSKELEKINEALKNSNNTNLPIPNLSSGAASSSNNTSSTQNSSNNTQPAAVNTSPTAQNGSSQNKR